MVHHRLAVPARRAAALLAGCLIVWALGTAATAAWAGMLCQPGAEPGTEHCRIGLAPDLLASLAQPQRASQWCWAASVSMLLGRYGLQVRQEDVVRAWYGSAVNLGVGAAALGQLLQRPWRDGRGRGVRTAFATVPASPDGLGSPAVLDELAGGRPLLLGSRGHAVLLVGVELERSAGGTRVLQATVLDPGVPGGLRPLGAAEAEFVATVDVRPLVEGEPEPHLARR